MPFKTPGRIQQRPGLFNTMQKENNRIVWLDLTRIFAAIAVVLIHVTLRSYTVQPFSTAWGIIDFYQLFPRWAVPVFLMISGTFFSIRKKTSVAKKHIPTTCPTFSLSIWLGLFSIRSYCGV